MLRSSVIAVFCVVALGFPVSGQETDQELRDEIEALKQGQAEIKKELAEIKQLLRAKRPAAPAGSNVEGKVFDLADNPIRGDQTAKLTLVEFTDYQ